MPNWEDTEVPTSSKSTASRGKATLQTRWMLTLDLEMPGLKALLPSNKPMKFSSKLWSGHKNITRSLDGEIASRGSALRSVSEDDLRVHNTGL